MVDPHPPGEAAVVDVVHDDPAGAVRGVAGPLHRGFTLVAGVAPEGALSDPAPLVPAEGNSHPLQPQDRRWGLPHQDLHHVLVGEVVAPLHRVVHVPLPPVLLLVPQGGRDPPLGGPGVAPHSVDLAHNGDIAGLRSLQGSGEPRDTRPDDDDLVLPDQNFLLLSSAILLAMWRLGSQECSMSSSICSSVRIFFSTTRSLTFTPFSRASLESSAAAS